MTFRTKKDGESALVITGEEDGTCELCGKEDELRPYGPKGENICFECGMKDEAATLRAFSSRLNNN